MFVPRPATHDGSPLGNSYLSQWLRCRRKWFARYLWPGADGATGLTTERGTLRLGTRGLTGPGSNLMLGAALHAYKEAWYRSGIRDGEDTGAYDHGAAEAHLHNYLTSRLDEFDSPEAMEWTNTNVLAWGEAFHRFYGPGGHTPLWPTEKVLCFPDGEPAIETQFAVPLGVHDLHGNEYLFTSRLDGIALWQDRYLVGLEHKTAAPSWADRYIAQLPKSSQFTGELFTLRNAPELRDLPWDKLRVCFHLKGWSPKSSFPTPVQFGDTSRTPEQLERFRLRVAEILTEIDEAVNSWNEGLSKGWPETTLRDRLFPETGEHTGECYSFNTECEFIASCQLGFGPGTLGGYRPARKPGATLSVDAEEAPE